MNALVDLKQHLPARIRRPLGKLRAISRRLRIWLSVAARMTGASRSDSRILWRAILKSPLTVWADLDRWQFPMVENDCKIVSKNIGTFSIRAWSDDLFHALPNQEPALEKAICSILREGDVFIDAGSNIGYYSILASNIVGNSGFVIAFEMIPSTAEILRSHLIENGCTRARVVEGAIATRKGEIVTAHIPSGKFGQASIATQEGDFCIQVATVTLEDEVREFPRIRLIKMDLEGAELDALVGLGASLSKTDAIIFEDHSGTKVQNFLAARGFLVRRLDGNNSIAVQPGAGINQCL